MLRFLRDALEARLGFVAGFLLAGVGAQGFGAPGFVLLFVGEGFPGLEGGVEVGGVAGFFFGFAGELVARHVPVRAVHLVLLF